LWVFIDKRIAKINVIDIYTFIDFNGVSFNDAVGLGLVVFE